MDTNKLETPPATEADLIFACRDDQGSVMPAAQANPFEPRPASRWSDRLSRSIGEHRWAAAGAAGIAGLTAALLAKSAFDDDSDQDRVTPINKTALPERRDDAWTRKEIDRAIQWAKKEKKRQAKQGPAKSSLGSKIGKGLLAAAIATAQGKLNAKALQRASGAAPANQPQPKTTGQPVPFATQRKPRQRPFSWWGLIKHTYQDWSEDKATRLGAALAYYTVFSIAPLLVIVLAIAGYFWGPDAVQGELHTQLAGMLGEEGAQGVEAMIAGANKPTQGTIATVISAVVLLLGATGVFAQMKDSLNTIWEVEPKPGQSWWGMIRDRFLSFAMVLGIAFLLLVSLVVSAGLNAVMNMLGDVIPGPDVVAHVVDIVVSIAVTTLLFALIFKYLPDVKIRWKDVWVGALLTAILFAVGKYAIGAYIGHAAFSSSYGAAASIIIVMIWAYYSSQILFLGAEFTEVYASMTGGRVLPDQNAIPLTPERDPRQLPQPQAA